MTLVATEAFEDMVLKAALNHTAQSEDQVLKLFKNDVTPTEASVAGDFTEADFTGYSSASITGSSWTISGGSGSYTQQSFASTADQTSQSIYGYYIVRASSGELLWAERFSDGPYTIAYDGDQINVTLGITVD